MQFVLLIYTLLKSGEILDPQTHAKFSNIVPVSAKISSCEISSTNPRKIKFLHFHKKLIPFMVHAWFTLNHHDLPNYKCGCAVIFSCSDYFHSYLQLVEVEPITAITPLHYGTRGLPNVK